MVAAATRFEKICVAPPDPGLNGKLAPRIEAIVEAAREGDEARIRAGLVEMEIGYNAARR